ncbi:hypothetical protein ACOJUR_00165 [Alicyclobacillus tolerans]|uniref:Uncharacterized protein n=2 Tax=Alicyclobacillus tolerans TaxID=90970 RepID=A0ABT9LTY8_9BACL|nr:MULTISPECIES: hypothetical protein [Alicyclobacillus]MDP9727730.1 hypothetical protein [Alicyclobacillus tengchongensis]QRF24415.1 hypothetical protein FY534_12840 [Alicyclobacillus sp. TC]SHK55321.1 hypothetical protein SAMN05443507_11651 [Alicyclobacillus montanus]
MVKGWHAAFIIKFAAALCGLGMLGASLAEQTQIQGQMNTTMATIRQSIAATIPVVEKTADALTPLVNISTSLQQIEQSEQQTVLNIDGMNQHLSIIGQEELSILGNFGTLNNVTLEVGQHLNTIGSLNQNLLSVSSASAATADNEDGSVLMLNRITAQSVAHLQNINRRLQALSLLP